jgi:mono/diheme cytochrome c family protein
MPQRSLRVVSAGAGLGLALAFLVVPPNPARAQTRPAAPERARLRQITSIDGKDLYNAYCAQCHGAGGKGDGPGAVTLKTPPADLTQLAAKNGGKYNRKAVESFIKGDRPGGKLEADSRGNPIIVTPNGPDEMPVWGIIFRYMWPDEPITIRCGNLARYIEKIQAK